MTYAVTDPAGGVHEIVAWFSPGVAVTLVGAPGTTPADCQWAETWAAVKALG